MRNRTFVLAALLVCGAISGPAFAAGDAANGAIVFKRCAFCHTVTNGGANGVGPNLFAIVGKKAAARDGFNYSGPLKSANLTWSSANLTKWVAGPARMVPGSKMAFPGLTSKTQQADVVAYLESLK